MRTEIPTTTPIRRINPIALIVSSELAFSWPGGNLKNSRLTAKRETTAVVSYKRSIRMVAKVALGLIRSRKLRTAGLMISPARPITNIEPKPTDVAAKRLFNFVAVIGARKAFHLKLRASSVKLMSTAANNKGHILAFRRCAPTVSQSRRLTNHQANPRPIARIKTDFSFLPTNKISPQDIVGKGEATTN
ncbi:MAG: hypothetical protein JMDDDDMK_00145 [Acidobacteria bacterium]|nr:hypothetical protein [Acidobacteriota bacterium]